MRTLQVTSPYMSGKDVKRAQQRLQSNVFKQDYLQGSRIDGEFGPASGRSCIRAKYWLGYAEKDQVATYGPNLDNFLTGKTKLPEKQKKARQARIKKRKQKPLREKAFERAARDVGMKESPANSNSCPISKRWGMRGPWCAMAVSIWYIDAGSKAFREHIDWAYVPYMLSAATNGGRGLSIVTLGNVKRGDIVTFDWQQNNEPDHVGLFDRWITQDRFKTIEGNTGPQNWSNGGAVMRMERSVSQVARSRGRHGFIHVGK
jgi:hypothetical protein